MTTTSAKPRILIDMATEVPSLKGTQANLTIIDDISIRQILLERQLGKTSLIINEFTEKPKLKKQKPYWRKNERW